MSDDGLIRYNFTTINGAADAIDAALASMRSTLSQLESDLRPLETDAWTSEAQQAYRQQKSRWENGANDIATTLDQIKAALNTAAEHMHETDRKAASYFQQ